MHIQSQGGSMGTISACRSRGNKNARVARALARYARRTGPQFSLNILRSILRTFGGTVSPFFYERSLYISHERHESGCHDNEREKRFALHCATAKNLRFRDHSRICGTFAKLYVYHAWLFVEYIYIIEQCIF